MRVVRAGWEEIKGYFSPLVAALDNCIVLSIGAGGTRIWEQLGSPLPHLPVECRRPSSRSRLKRALVAAARPLPEPLRNLFRSLEHRFLMSFEPRTREVVLPEEAEARICGFRKAVIIDDAVDTGETLRAVTERLRAAGFEGEITAIVYAWTNTDSAVKPDRWHVSEVLVKFPWSRKL